MEFEGFGVPGFDGQAVAKKTPFVRTKGGESNYAKEFESAVVHP